MDPRITHLTARQHGVVTRRQLLALGVPPDTVRELVRSGRVRRVSNGVYVLPGSPPTPEQEAMTAALRCGPDAVVVGERMLAFAGIREARRDGPFTVLTRPGRRVTGVPWAWRTDPAPGRDRALILAVPSLRPPRLVLEAALDVSDESLTRLVDGIRWSSHGVRSLRGLTNALPDHPGTARLLTSGLIAPDAPESPPERKLVVVVGHLSPQTQVLLLGRHRVDLYLPVARLVLEYDGEPHEAPARAAADARRDAELHAAGYHVLRLTSTDLRDEAALLRRVEALVARRATQLATC